MSTTQTSINIPQIIAVALVGFLAIRWFLNKPTPSQTSGSSTRGRDVDVTKIEQISAMFPQMDRRTIAWDLHSNGQNVSATTERILANRGLDQPPPSYQPQLPPVPSATTGASTQSGSQAARTAGSGKPDLITRYGLQSRVHGKGKEPVASEEQLRGGWKGDKLSRADELKRRREEMVLAARRKMMEKDLQT